MACLWKYHKLRGQRVPVISAPVGQTQNELEAALHGEEVVTPTEEAVPAPVKSTRGRNPRSPASVQAEGQTSADAPQTS
jgi:hypothetical protein